MLERVSRAAGGRFFDVVEAEQIGAGNDDETEGLGRLGGNLRSRNGVKEPNGASRPDINKSEAIPLASLSLER